MLMMPFGLLFLWLTGLLSLGLLGGGAYLIWGWYEGRFVHDAYLWAGLAMLAVTLLGRFLVPLLLGRPRGPDEPEPGYTGTPLRVSGPDGTELQAEVYGPENAPTIVMTHGWGLNSTEWYYAKRHLADRFRLIVWDLPGLGRSSRPSNNEYALEKMARDLEAVVAAAGNGPVFLLGHSIGGMITLTFCRLFPEQLGRRVAGLILTHTTYTNPVQTARGSGLLRALQKPLLEPLLFLMIPLSPLVRLMNGLSYANGTTHLHAHWTHFGGKETRGQLEFVCRLGLKASPSVVARGMLAMLRWDVSETLPTIPVPTLVIAGDRDKATVPEANRHIAQTVPGARLLALTPAGHAGLIEQNAAWLEAVAGFCAQNRKAPQTEAPVAV